MKRNAGKKQRLGYFETSVELVESLFHFPKDYKIVDAEFDKHLGHLIIFVESEKLNEVATFDVIPKLAGQVKGSEGRFELTFEIVN